MGGVDFSKYWSYRGSLTTPPCTEGIKWSVISQVQPISDAQLLAYTQFFAGNPKFAQGKGDNRVVQPLGQRILYFNAASSLAAQAA